MLLISWKTNKNDRGFFTWTVTVNGTTVNQGPARTRAVAQSTAKAWVRYYKVAGICSPFIPAN